MEYLEIIVDGLLDCVQECVETLVVVTGKKILWILGVTVCFLVFAVICNIAGLPCFVSWQEGLTAVCIVGALTGITFTSRSAIKQFVEKRRSGADGKKE